MPDHSADQIRTCPECGAQLAEGATVCWLCRHERLDDDPLVPAEVVAPPASATMSGPQYTLVTLLLVIALAAVLFGVATRAWGIAVVLSIVALPALVRTAVVSRRRERLGQVVTTGNRVTSFLASFAVIFFAMWGIVCTVAVVAVVAFFAWCLASGLGGGGPMF